MPKPRALTDLEEDEALAEFERANGRRGVMSNLASQHGLTWKGMRGCLERAAARRASALGDSRESPNSGANA
jgi:hypothetical protein